MAYKHKNQTSVSVTKAKKGKKKGRVHRITIEPTKNKGFTTTVHRHPAKPADMGGYVEPELNAFGNRDDMMSHLGETLDDTDKDEM